MILSLITPVLGSLTVAFANETIIINYVSKYNQAFFNVDFFIVFVFVHLIYYDFEFINKDPEHAN